MHHWWSARIHSINLALTGVIITLGKLRALTLHRRGQLPDAAAPESKESWKRMWGQRQSGMMCSRIPRSTAKQWVETEEKNPPSDSPLMPSPTHRRVNLKPLLWVKGHCSTEQQSQIPWCQTVSQFQRQWSDDYSSPVGKGQGGGNQITFSQQIIKDS